MNLTIETVRDTLNDFAIAYGIPAHVKGPDNMEDIVWIYHRELSKHFTDEKFNTKAASIAWSKTRKFPAVSDFFEGFGGVNSVQDYQQLLKDYK